MWVLGVILILLGSLGNNLGNNLVSLAHKKSKELISEATAIAYDSQKTGAEASKLKGILDEEIPAQLLVVVKPSLTRWRFSLRTIGTLVFVFGNLFTFAAFGFGAQSLLASLESVQFVSNVVFAKYVHKEKITARMIVATCSIVVGNVLVVVFSDHVAKLYTSRDIIYLYRNNTPYHAYLVVAGTLWVMNHFTYSHYYHVRIKEQRLLWKHSFIEPFTFTVSSTIIGTQAVLLSKCMSMLIQVSAKGDNEFTKPTVFVVLASWLILVAYWLRRLDVGLALYPPLFIIPVMQVFFVFFAIMCGGIYFEEFQNFTASQYVGFVVGVLMILGGVYGLAPTDVPIIPPTVVTTEVSTSHTYAYPDKNLDLEKGADSTEHDLMEKSSDKKNSVCATNIYSKEELKHDYFLPIEKSANPSGRGGEIEKDDTDVSGSATPCSADSDQESMRIKRKKRKVVKRMLNAPSTRNQNQNQNQKEMGLL